MKNKLHFIGSFVLCLIPLFVFAQSDFYVEDYIQFLQNNTDLDSYTLMSSYAPEAPYYNEINSSLLNDRYLYFNAIQDEYQLTESENELLERNDFVVSERLSFCNFGQAFFDIYAKDLPVFISTDAILHALHSSYDYILIDIEYETLLPKLTLFVDALYNSFPLLLNRYQSHEALHDALGDVDLYVTIAKSLLAGSAISPQYTSSTQVHSVYEAIQEEQLVFMPLFTENTRKLDFSQFTVRGHYLKDFGGGRLLLAPYFKCMMWLGRIDFFLTPPPDDVWNKEEIRRMNLGAVLLNELIDLSEVRTVLDEIDEIITFMVGESDNLTPAELKGIIHDLGINAGYDLLNDSIYDAFQQLLISSSNCGQKILSNFFIMNPCSPEPDVLPVSFRLLGQRFVIDSYIFSNVVYDRIIYNNHKIWRPMPDPLDILFVLGNDDALPLLESELDQYHYSSQLAALRYLVDAYDREFWDQSLYNLWLQAIRSLNPLNNITGMPLFMQTTAWHQEKMNTQLASWAQLRHDNLLYAKQSYTGSWCSFPHSFVEPYPEFYGCIAAFAEKAESFFPDIDYFSKLKDVMCQLEVIAQKELNRQVLNSEEQDFLHKMLFLTGKSGKPPFTGWYADLFYDQWHANKIDYLVADVHTQPTDEWGAIVGRILHVGVGYVNLGVFLAESPSDDYRPMAFIGPVMSYYEKITEDFDRLTDERWSEWVRSEDIPARPDWANIYLADRLGNALSQGRELPGVSYITGIDESLIYPEEYCLYQNYPNPFNPVTMIKYDIEKSEHVRIMIYDATGRHVRTLVDEQHQAGRFDITWNGSNEQNIPVASGIYFCRMEAGDYINVMKLLLVR